MLTRQLGRTALQVTVLCLGGNVFGWTCDEPTSFEVLNAYVAGGGNLIDTADSYSAWVSGHTGGESETIIGRWMKSRGNRERVIIATKVGSRMYTGPNMQGLSQRYIMEEVEASLKRLQTDYIDFQHVHVVSFTWFPSYLSRQYLSSGSRREPKSVRTTKEGGSPWNTHTPGS